MGIFEKSFTDGYDVPYCQIWMEGRNQKPPSPFSSMAGLGLIEIFNDRDDALTRHNLLSVQIIENAKGMNEAVINFLDSAGGILDQGICDGTKVWIKLGYARRGLANLTIEPAAIMKMSGVMQRPSVTFDADGKIVVQVKIRDLTDKLRYEKRTASYSLFFRSSVVQTTLMKYVGDVFQMSPVINFKGMTEYAGSPRNPLRQVMESDLAFMYRCARLWGATFDIRYTSDGKLRGYFVDDDAAGDDFIGVLEMSMAMTSGSVYKMDWRKGIGNCKSLKISGETSAKGNHGGVLERADTGRMEIVPHTVSDSDDDPANWEIDPGKVRAYIQAHPGTNTDDILALSFSSQRATYLQQFFRKRVATTGAKAADAANPNLGANGYKADFELTRGDPFLTSNMAVELGGDIYRRYKSTQARAGTMEFAGALPAERFTTRSGDLLYWRVDKVTHTFDHTGFNTKGTLKR